MIHISAASTAMIIMALVVPITINIIAFVILLFWDIEKYQSEVTSFIQGQNNKEIPG